MAPKYSLPKEKIKFLLLEGVHERAIERIERAGYSNLRVESSALAPDELRDALAGVHFLGIRSRSQISAEILDQADKLAAIGCFCIGTDQVDLASARRRGIPVFNAPYANTRSVAELVLAEIIMLMRGIPEKNMAAHRGQWLKTARGSNEVRGKTLGIVGFGHIGSQLGVLAEGLGMHVVFYDIADRLALGNATRLASLEALLESADIISLHVPDTDKTRGMIGAGELAAMKKGARLINASRGRVVDIPALANALKKGHLAGAAIDVFPQEPVSGNEEFVSELRGMDQVLLTPHIGGSTREAQQNIGLDVASKLVRYSDNGSTMGAVNFPEVALPDHATARRILHIHRNEPGVMNAINGVFSRAGVNIAAQYLQTSTEIGYVVMDAETDHPRGIIKALETIPGTLRTRFLNRPEGH